MLALRIPYMFLSICVFCNAKTQTKVSFSRNTLGNKKVYIQSAYAIPSEEKLKSELKPFSLTGDSFPKMVVRKDIGKRWYDDEGVLNIGLIDFLLDRSVI